MNILITGGCGFVGQELAKRLSNENKVSVLDIIEGSLTNVNYIKGSILNEEDIDTAMKDIDVVFHLAAQIQEGFSRENPLKDNEINTHGTITILEGCKRNNIKRIIYASTAAIYGQPQHDYIDESHPTDPSVPYGCSKHSAETYIKAYNKMYGIKYTILRFFNLYGGLKGKGVINIFFDKALKNENLTINGTGGQCRDFLYIDDAIDAYVLSLKQDAENEIFNIGSGEKTSIKDLAEKIIEITKSESKIIYVPQKDVSVLYPIANYGRSKIKLNFEPKISFEDGLKLMLKKLK